MPDSIVANAEDGLRQRGGEPRWPADGPFDGRDLPQPPFDAEVQRRDVKYRLRRYAELLPLSKGHILESAHTLDDGGAQRGIDPRTSFGHVQGHLSWDLDVLHRRIQAIRRGLRSQRPFTWAAHVLLACATIAVFSSTWLRDAVGRLYQGRPARTQGARDYWYQTLVFLAATLPAGFRVGALERRISSVDVVRDGLVHLLSQVRNGESIDKNYTEFLDSGDWNAVPWTEAPDLGS